MCSGRLVGYSGVMGGGYVLPRIKETNQGILPGPPAVLFKQRILAGIREGNVTLAFRRWRRPTVKAGGTLLTPVGLLGIDAVRIVHGDGISEDDARTAGYDDLATLRKELDRREDGEVYRVEFHVAGPDPRIALRERGDVSPDEIIELRRRLARLDRSSRKGAWTEAVLRSIADNPGVRAPDLASALGLETLPFKRDVRKLKALGLTESLKVGYRLSPRGTTLLAALGPDS